MTEYASDLSDFKDLLRAVADSKRQRAAIIEKDYYLCAIFEEIEKVRPKL